VKKPILAILLLGILLIHWMVASAKNTNPESVFLNPPASASPGVLWMWMGSNISKQGITNDLEALKKVGFNRTTLFSLSDVTTPWAGEIQNSPTPNLIAWTEPWWAMVKHAALESKRLGMDFGMFNCPGYEASGGPWITPELSMQELCFSEFPISQTGHWRIELQRPQPDMHANMPWPIYNPLTGLVEKPKIEERSTYYRDIAVLAAPASGNIDKTNLLDLTGRMQADGSLEWDVPPGEWIIYRIGHTTMGSLIQPAQWAATGLECDKMNPEAVAFHMDHVIGELKKHLGNLFGKGFSHVHFDSYEAGVPSWTPRMRAEFNSRRGYDLQPYLLTLAGRTVGNPDETRRFKKDFERTIHDLYRDVYFKTIQQKLQKAKLEFLAEPYGGPWQLDEVMPMVGKVMTEFWTNNGRFTPYELEQTIAALRKSGQNIVEAEAFTGGPIDSKWNETPAWLKPIGDAAFCAGVNRLVLHRFTHQPWNETYKPGMAMGQWGTHFDRTQTWWQEMPALVMYWKRCQALLQWGELAENQVMESNITSGSLQLKSICRTDRRTKLFFVANTSHSDGKANCIFPITGFKPELWNPMTGEIRMLPQFYMRNGTTEIPLQFADAQSFFLVFRKKTTDNGSALAINFPVQKAYRILETPWQVQFDPKWGGPTEPVTFDKLQDWTSSVDAGIKYYSGSAVYSTVFDATLKRAVVLSLGTVKSVAHIWLNGIDLGTLWSAPWELKLPSGLLQPKNNKLEIRITNVWANRLIGDHQFQDDCEWLQGHQGGQFLKRFPDWFVKGTPRPSKNRYCFTTWDYFTKDSPLESSGLMGPVKLLCIQ
jgi:hypothetical protein